MSMPRASTSRTIRLTEIPADNQFHRVEITKHNTLSFELITFLSYPVPQKLRAAFGIFLSSYPVPSLILSSDKNTTMVDYASRE